MNRCMPVVFQQLAEAGIELARLPTVDACAMRVVDIAREHELASHIAFVGSSDIARVACGDFRLIPAHDPPSDIASCSSGTIAVRCGGWTAAVVSEPGEPQDGWTALLWSDADSQRTSALQTLARQAGLAIGLLRERERQRHRERQQEALVEAGKALTQELHLDAVLHRIVETATSLVGARYGALGVIDDSGQRLERFVTTGLTAEQEARIGALPSGRGILGMVMREARPVRLPDLTAHAESVGYPDHHPPMHSFLGVPISTGHNVRGRLYLTEKIGADEFSSHDEQIAVTLASQAAIALENAALYEELEHANHQLAEASRHKSIFLANMSHELRSPLNTIIGYASLLLDEPDALNAEQLEDLRIIQASSKHLLTLIADLLDLSKIEAGKLVLHPAPMDVAPIVREVIAALQPQAHAAVSMTYTGPESLMMIGDRGRIRQMLLNVMGNAVKFTHEGQVAAHVATEGDHVVLTVTDTGSGIPDHDLARIFDSFFQSQAAQARTPREHEGAGLGLAITQALAMRHGGRVDITSLEHEGTRVTITLPRETPSRDRSTQAADEDRT